MKCAVMERITRTRNQMCGKETEYAKLLVNEETGYQFSVPMCTDHKEEFHDELYDNDR